MQHLLATSVVLGLSMALLTSAPSLDDCQEPPCTCDLTDTPTADAGPDAPPPCLGLVTFAYDSNNPEKDGCCYHPAPDACSHHNCSYSLVLTATGCTDWKLKGPGVSVESSANPFGWSSPNRRSIDCGNSDTYDLWANGQHVRTITIDCANCNA